MFRECNDSKSSAQVIRSLRSVLIATAVVVLVGSINFGVGIYRDWDVESAESGSAVADFLRGFSLSISLMCFVVEVILIVCLWRAARLGRLFSPMIIYYCQCFGVFLVMALVSRNIANLLVDASSSLNFEGLATAFMVIVFAQIMKIGYKLQQEQELTI